MSNGLSEMTQFIFNYEQDRKDNIRERKAAILENYVNSYIKITSQKKCTCSACKVENAIHPVQIVRTSKGVSELWKCDNCGRTVPRTVSNVDFSYMINEDRQNVTA